MERCKHCGKPVVRDHVRPFGVVGLWVHRDATGKGKDYRYICGDKGQYDVEPDPKLLMIKQYFYGREQGS